MITNDVIELIVSSKLNENTIFSSTPKLYYVHVKVGIKRAFHGHVILMFILTVEYSPITES